MGIDEIPALVKFAIIVVIVGVIGVGGFWFLIKPQNEENHKVEASLKAKNDENATLRQFEPKLAEINRQMAELQIQLEIQKKIVPDDKDADGFIKLLHDTGAASGIELRRYTAMPVGNHEFYSEVPFQVDLDGPYYAVLNFFDRMAKLERIVNISNLQMANTKNGTVAKVKSAYTYAPGETVVASCTATTFFSRDIATVGAPNAPAAPNAPKK